MSIEDKVKQAERRHKPKAKKLSEEEFVAFVSQRASKAREEVDSHGYCRLTKFNRKVLSEGINFTPLQQSFLLLYFQPFSTMRHGLNLQERNREIGEIERMFIENVPYQTSFNLDEYLHRKDFSKVDILIVPCAGYAGIPFKQMRDGFYGNDIIRDHLFGANIRRYQNFRDGNMHADGMYSFILIDTKGGFAIISFELEGDGPVVKQIQGFNGAKDKLDNWAWESALFHVAEDWASKQGFRKIQLYNPEEIKYTKLDPSNEHYVPLERIATRFERVCKNRGLVYNGKRYVKTLQPRES